MKKAFLAGIILLFVTNLVLAEPRNANDAKKVVKGWLRKTEGRPLDVQVGQVVKKVETFADPNGEAVYHIVYLNPSGFVIVPADDEVEPIIGFAPTGEYISSTDNPLGALVTRDLGGRIWNVRKEAHKKGYSPQSNSHKIKWSELEAVADQGDVLHSAHIPLPNDVRVAPLLQTKWGQTAVCGNACYNYYTPPGPDGEAGNYPCGCVATAMAQYMRFWQYPTVGVGTACSTIYVCGSQETRCLRGGDGSGGPYNWAQMVLEPDCSTTLTQRQAIGALTYDAGVAVDMNYCSDGSGAYLNDASTALVSKFGYSNAIFGYNNGFNIGSGLNAMVNPNLDANNPVLLGIAGGSPPNDYGHAVVADGYGYNISTLYHHLNMGWDGSPQDTWYNLPNIDSSPSYSAITGVIYNIYISDYGEIISGRVTDASGSPVPGADVMAMNMGQGYPYQTVTNSKGIYAFRGLYPYETYYISVTKSGYSFSSQIVSTGYSLNNSNVSGNQWAIDFNDTSIPSAFDARISTMVNTPVEITLLAQDDGLPDPPGVLSYIITSLPSHGGLTDPEAGLINSVPYTLVADGNQVIYTPNNDYIGPDAFQFIVSDGGAPPVGGNSNTATVSIMVHLPSYAIIDLGMLPGYTEWSEAHGINNAGQIVGSCARGEYPYEHAFLWEDGAIAELSGLGPGPTTLSVAYAINNYKHVIGYKISYDIPPEDRADRAFLWRDGVATDLGTLGGSWSIAYALNDFDQVVGESWTGAPYNIQAFLWQNGFITRLYIPGASYSRASGINDSGQIVGYANVNGVGVQPFLWEKGVTTFLLPQNGYQYSGYGNGINNAGQVVGYGIWPGGGTAGCSDAFLWQDGILTNLGSLTEPHCSASAVAINNLGQIVGSADASPFSLILDHAFLWEDGVMSDLNAKILPDTGWELIAALAINDYGQIIGAGIINGEQHSFLLTPCGKPSIEQQPSSATICNGQSNEFCIAASGSDPMNYQWRKDDVNIPDANGPCYEANEPGTYRCIVSNGCGSETSEPATLTVNPSPTPMITAIPGETVCEGTTVTLDAGAGYNSYLWMPSGETTRMIEVTNSGFNIVRVTNESGCEGMDDITITVVETVPGDFDTDCDVDFADLEVLAEQWLQPPGNTSADIAPQPNGDGIVNFLDFALMAENWMK